MSLLFKSTDNLSIPLTTLHTLYQNNTQPVLYPPYCLVDVRKLAKCKYMCISTMLGVIIRHLAISYQSPQVFIWNKDCGVFPGVVSVLSLSSLLTSSFLPPPLLPSLPPGHPFLYKRKRLGFWFRTDFQGSTVSRDANDGSPEMALSSIKGTLTVQ